MWRALHDMDWDAWTPRQRATLVFIVRDGQVLLIHKKRGIGAGYINGVGGRLEPGETPFEGRFLFDDRTMLDADVQSA